MPRRARRPGLSIALAAGFAALYAGLASAIALDRAAGSRPELARFVPRFAQQEARLVVSRQLTQAGRPEQALHLAESVVKRDPLSPHATGLLGTARLGRGDIMGATAAFRVSAKLGWRDAATQVFWFDQAVRAGNFELAGARFSAMARQWPNAPAIDGLSARLASDPRGLHVLARDIASGVNWATAFARPRAYQSTERLAGRARVLIAAGALGGKLGCDAVAALVGTLTRPSPQLAGELWARQCARAAPPGELANGGFESPHPPGPSTAFDWQFPGNGALVSTIVDFADGKALRVSSNNSRMLPIAVQLVILPSRRYQISWLESGNKPSRIAASLSCKPDQELTNLQDGAGSTGRRSVSIQAPAECSAALLELWLKPGAGEVTVDNVSIDPL